ncbi:MAG TPA: hypothetical protein VNB24_04890, partial [Acidimicrobiales bacterium]|nr:hypothetical protein [Acidimicrobiales bacterium]
MDRGTLLDLPEDEHDIESGQRSLLRRGALAATLIPVLWIAAAIVVARVFAVGGWSNHWLVVGALLAIPAAALSWYLIGPGEQRSLWAASFVVIGLVLVPVASSGATPSTGRLADVADGLDLPGKTVRTDGAKGNGRCRPACSELHRVVVSEQSSFTKIRTQVTNALKDNGYLVRVYGTGPDEPQRMTAKSNKVII